MALTDVRVVEGEPVSVGTETEEVDVLAQAGIPVKVAGYTYTPAVSSAGVISWTNDGGLPNPDPVNIKGANGDDGQDGFSPEVSVETITGGHEVTITDAEGDHTFEVMDGEDGADGQDGYSPTVEVTEITGGHEVTITDAEGDHTFEVMDGEKGETGEQGEKGDDGDDGFSPTVEVTEITGGHRVTITDAEEAHVFDVMDGQSGGTDVHNDLTGRDAADAHPMSAITGLVTALAGKQDTISDLATIRSGADLGATALQAVPNTYRTAAAQDVIDNGKQAKITANGVLQGDGTGNVTAKTVDTAVTEDSTNLVTSGAVFTALAGKQDTISDLATIRSGADLGATALQAVPNTYRTAAEQDTIDATKQEKATAVTGTGAVNFTVADNREYSYTGVTSLTMAAANVEAHGFVTFGSTTPTISITGFAGSGGDDITGAAASEVWEFSVFSHNSGAYILWKKWSA